MIDEPSFDVVLVKHTPEHPTITGESYRVVFTAEACEEMRREYPGALILTPGDIEQLDRVPVEGRWAAVQVLKSFPGARITQAAGAVTESAGVFEA